MENWTPKQVSQHIGKVGSADCWKQYAKIIIDEDLDGATFLHINQETLAKMGFRPAHAIAAVKERDRLLSSPPPSGFSPASLAASSSPPAYSAQNNDNDYGLKKGPQCSVHNRPFEGYCTQDHQLVCATCSFSTHKGHPCDPVNDVFLREKASIESLLNEATGRSKEWIKAADQISAMKKQAQLNNDRVVAEMDNFFTAVEKKIRERKERLRSELKRLIEEKLITLTKQEEELRNAVKGLDKVGGSVQQYLETKSAVECLQLKQEIVIQLGGDKQRQGKEGGGGVRCEPDCGVDMDFVGDVKPIGEMIDGLGELSGGEWAVASECEARGPGLETVRAGQSTEFMIMSKNGKGEVVKKGRDSFQVRVRSGNTDKVANVVRQSEEEGIFKCTYQTDNGNDVKELAVSVMLRGGHVRGSPFTVKISTHPQFLPQYCGALLTLSQNNTVVTKSGGGERWNAAVLADNGNNSNVVVSYRVKIISGCAGTMIGFATKAINKNGENHHSCGFYLHTYSGNIYSQQQKGYKEFGRSCYAVGTVIECVLDTVKHEIWFGVDGDKPKLAHQDVPADVRDFAVNFYNQGSSLELLD